MENEKILVKKLKEKNESAFDAIYEKYYKLIYYIIFKTINDKEVTKELVSDVFLKMYQKIEQHDVTKSFKYWLITIAKNTAKQYLRDNNEKVVDSEFIDEIEDTGDNFSRLLSSCSRVLSPLEFDVLNKHIVFEMTFEEIGELMGKSKSTAQRIFKESIEKIKAEI